jgi:tetratricopeptide (TPR) repeat protein
MDESNYPLAESSFQNGIEIAPTDQLLRLSLANCYLAQNKNSEARKQLRLAQTYKHCVRPFFLHANQLVVKCRPRAALRRLDMALERLGDNDLSPNAWNSMRALGWEIRVLAARCACLCAERELSSRFEGDLPWSRQHLPKALERLHIALQFAPGHEPLRQMEARARQLMSMAQ